MFWTVSQSSFCPEECLVIHQTSRHPEPDAYICEARIRVTGTSPLIIAKKAAEMTVFLWFSKCRRGFLLRGFRDPPLPATPVRLGSRTLRPFHLADGSVPRVREHVVGSDLLLAYPLWASSKDSLPWGLAGVKGRGCAGRECGDDPISQFEPATLVPKRKTRLARQAPSWS